MDGAVDDHNQRNKEGEEKRKLMPAQVKLGLSLNHEALAVGFVVFQSEDVS